ncbi:MAG: hypothetical protein QOI64_2507 [Solirubrobacteraceae bacterium]|jgi:hypothetical protein|nr:hypothetical protein [Solirubrobacteraceae bacterium]
MSADELTVIVDIEGDLDNMPFGFGAPELLIMLAILSVIGLVVRAILR